jgi:hypothetical protein
MWSKCGQQSVSRRRLCRRNNAPTLIWRIVQAKERRDPACTRRPGLSRQFKHNGEGGEGGDWEAGDGGFGGGEAAGGGNGRAVGRILASDSAGVALVMRTSPLMNSLQGSSQSPRGLPPLMWTAGHMLQTALQMNGIS